MKANQAFKANEDAVSPVIGVILMVAITVVLAAVVFVLVGNLTDTSESAPTVVFTYSDTDGTARVTTADTNLVWSQFTYSGCTTLTISGTAYTLPNATADAAAVGGGNVFSGCTGTFSLVHDGTNTEVASHTFP